MRANPAPRLACLISRVSARRAPLQILQNEWICLRGRMSVAASCVLTKREKVDWSNGLLLSLTQIYHSLETDWSICRQRLSEDPSVVRYGWSHTSSTQRVPECHLVGRENGAAKIVPPVPRWRLQPESRCLRSTPPQRLPGLACAPTHRAAQDVGRTDYLAGPSPERCRRPRSLDCGNSRRPSGSVRSRPRRIDESEPAHVQRS
jgi:hypothetical protein